MRCLLLSAAALSMLVLPAKAPANEPAAQLTLVVVEGEGAINNIKQRTARDVIVQVDDENHKPVAGVAVTFALPAEGAGGSFAGGTQTVIARTDNLGRAVAHGFRPNGIQGQFQIHVNASFQGQTAAINIAQTNSMVATGTAGAAAGGISGKLIAVLVAVGAAAAGGAVVATRSSGGSSGGGGTIQQPATGTVGAGSGVQFGPPH
jgi:hypothetical protein